MKKLYKEKEQITNENLFVNILNVLPYMMIKIIY